MTIDANEYLRMQLAVIAADAMHSKMKAELELAEHERDFFDTERMKVVEQLTSCEVECAALRAAIETMRENECHRADELATLRAEVDRLRALNDQVGNAHAAAVRDRGFADEQRRAAESRLRAEVDRLSARYTAEMNVSASHFDRAEAAESRLAVANALLHELDAAAEIMPEPKHLRANKRICIDAKRILAGLIEERRAHLAAQPAASTQPAIIWDEDAGMYFNTAEKEYVKRWAGKPGLSERDILAHSAAEYAQIIADSEDSSEAKQRVLDVVDHLSQTLEYSIQCDYVQHAAVDWLRARVAKLQEIIK
jgi:hypothetical protein